MPTPTFVDAGTYAAATAATITPALPGSRVNGNLLIAFAHYGGAPPSAQTWAVSSGWTVLASINQGTTIRRMLLA
ncbi:hypothetical protein JQ615_28195 [Bradyrhizobium jicamae]|uniref:Uncharacterized protein n=1 Tax=Bradyrhizobium jicamae TaxID=280332 RepID=A0ABS5FR47_9BRAD|nr:hypothetical protein [Bradyrhizobium jicamae]MBR0799277.1 hypothetical protein [Bradyrhizobium jicamae]